MSWHLAGHGIEVVSVLSEHAFGKRENLDLEIEEILNRVVVLEAVHPPNRRPGRGCLCRDGGVQQIFQGRHELSPFFGRQRGFVLRRHFLEIQRFDQFANQLGILREVGGGLQFQQVDLAFYLVVLAMALDAALLQRRLENVREGGRACIGSRGAERNENRRRQRRDESQSTDDPGTLH